MCFQLFLDTLVEPVEVKEEKKEVDFFEELTNQPDAFVPFETNQSLLRNTNSSIDQQVNYVQTLFISFRFSVEIQHVYIGL